MTFARPLVVSLAVGLAAPTLAAPMPAITSMPGRMTVSEGAFVLSNATRIHVPAGDSTSCNGT